MDQILPLAEAISLVEANVLHRRYQTSLDDLQNLMTSGANFAEQAYAVARIMQQTFMYFCFVADKQKKYQMLFDKIITSRSIIVDEGQKILQVVRLSRDVPGPNATELEVRQASVVTLRGLVSQAEGSASQITTHVAKIRSALVEATQLANSYIRNV